MCSKSTKATAANTDDYSLDNKSSFIKPSKLAPLDLARKQKDSRAGRGGQRER